MSNPNQIACYQPCPIPPPVQPIYYPPGSLAGLGQAQTGGWWFALGFLALGALGAIMFLSPKRELRY